MAYAYWVCQWVLKILPCIFWMRFYITTWHISMIFLSWKMPMLLWAFVFMCTSSTFLSHIDNTSFFLPIFFGEFWQESYACMWGHYGSRIMGVFLGPFGKVSGSTIDIFDGIGLLSMKDCAPFTFLGSWALVAPFLCLRFLIFDKLVLEEYVSQVEGGPHLLESCLRVTWDDLFLVVRKMHLFFWEFGGYWCLRFTSIFDGYIHHDTSFGYILEDDSISSTFRIRIHFCLGKGVKLWLVVRPSIYSFHITHFIFTLALHFHLGLIQPLTSNLFMCECGHKLDTFGTHLVRCSFGGQ
jgi:hypothetical protein